MGKTYRHTKNVWEDGERRDNRSKKKAKKKFKLDQRRKVEKHQVFDSLAGSPDNSQRRHF